MKKTVSLMVLLSLSVGCSSAQTPNPLPPFLGGVDASYVSRVEDRGGLYKDADGKTVDFFQTLKASGVNQVRLRVWNHPTDSYGSQWDMLKLAKRAHVAGLGILLDLHYSDSWADPGHQTKPNEWKNLSYFDLKTAVRQYTRSVVQSMLDQGTAPDLVQIGNEISAGMLWDEGRVWGPDADFNTDQQWNQLSELLKAGIAGVKDTGSQANIVIHIDKGGSNAEARNFYDRIVARGVEFDTIALSYYPYWHGPLDKLKANVADLMERYSKDVILAETAYPFTLGWNDWTNNVIGLPEQLPAAYKATPEDQARMLSDLIAALKSVQGKHRTGVFYWGGEWISTGKEDTSGSSWENQALFDFDGKVLPVLKVFR
ncbi:glycoside hydrolase family 53 protein [Deinococcus roseus]|uniref:Arabinogalactan endo-beta-1,4-galactanase n=1 Tax=Deinococcus roseus TaxID=392414 RepID=A0ABQ2CWK6_9DEIO|nr:glycosyl hydrolase 53 family protein [Deinococcus roseus]GGJ28110.1 hypothetical protein GCM10008938_12770 [Deinococcus roseus]